MRCYTYSTLQNRYFIAPYKSTINYLFWKNNCYSSDVFFVFCHWSVHKSPISEKPHFVHVTFVARENQSSSRYLAYILHWLNKWRTMLKDTRNFSPYILKENLQKRKRSLLNAVVPNGTKWCTSNIMCLMLRKTWSTIMNFVVQSLLD